jgi:uncharacterized protein YuzE
VEEEMRLKVDKESDALYFRLDDSAVVESEEVQPGVILDFDQNGRVVGVEILNLSTRSKPEQLRVLQFETT